MIYSNYHYKRPYFYNNSIEIMYISIEKYLVLSNNIDKSDEIYIKF